MLDRPNISQLIDLARSNLDRARPVKARVMSLWVDVKAARGCADNVVLAAAFTTLARESGLVADLHCCPPFAGEETIAHVISWGLRGMNPFEKGPLYDD